MRQQNRNAIKTSWKPTPTPTANVHGTGRFPLPMMPAMAPLNRLLFPARNAMQCSAKRDKRGNHRTPTDSDEFKDNNATVRNGAEPTAAAVLNHTQILRFFRTARVSCNNDNTSSGGWQSGTLDMGNPPTPPTPRVHGNGIRYTAAHHTEAPSSWEATTVLLLCFVRKKKRTKKTKDAQQYSSIC